MSPFVISQRVMAIQILGTSFSCIGFGHTYIVDSVASVSCTILVERVPAKTPKFYKSAKKYYASIIFTVVVPNFLESGLGVLNVTG